MAKLNIADIRQEYTKGGLRENELPGDPLSLFNRWLQEAIDAEVDEPTAVIVGTVSPEGRPSTRTVLLKGLHDGKFVFYTNYESRKGRQLAQNPYISLSFVWHASIYPATGRGMENQSSCSLISSIFLGNSN